MTLARCTELGLDAEGLHVHIGSQLLGVGAERMAIDWLAAFGADCRTELDWTPSVVDLGGGLGIPYTDEDPRLAVETFACEPCSTPRARVVAPRPAAAAGHPRARPVARRAGGRHALPRRLDQAGERERHVRRDRRRHVRQPAPAALRRAAHGAARQPRGRARRRRVRRLREALRVGRRDDRPSLAPEPRRACAVAATGAYTLE